MKARGREYTSEAMAMAQVRDGKTESKKLALVIEWRGCIHLFRKRDPKDSVTNHA